MSVFHCTTNIYGVRVGDNKPFISPAPSCSLALANNNSNPKGLEPLPVKGPPARFFIGLSLVVGFTLMFVVDQIGSYCSIHGKELLINLHIWFIQHQVFLAPWNWCLFIHMCFLILDPQTGMSNSTSITATLGLVMHAAGTVFRCHTNWTYIWSQCAG